METETQENPSKQRNPTYPKSLNKIRSKNLETMEITESSQIKINVLNPKLHWIKINIKHTTKIKKYDS